jgi:hypothetical protein
METNETPIRWKVVASRSYFWGHKIMKPGQIFTAAEKDLPANFRPLVVPLDNTIQVQKPPDLRSRTNWQDTVVPEPEPKPESPVYRVKEKANGEWYDVYDSKNKKVNEQKLTKEEAERFVKNLTT